MDDAADLRLARALELVTEAMRLSPRERVPRLRERCAEDRALLDAALPLLRACEAAASKLGPDNPTAEAGPPVARVQVPISNRVIASGPTSSCYISAKGRSGTFTSRRAPMRPVSAWR